MAIEESEISLFLAVLLIKVIKFDKKIKV